MPSGLLGALLLLSALLAARRTPNSDHLTAFLPHNATLATQHPPDCTGPPGRRCAAGDRAGTFCPESQLESPIYYNQSRSRHGSLGRVSTTEPCKDYQNPDSWSRRRGHQSWGPFSPESELEQEPSGHCTLVRSRSHGRNASLKLEPEPFNIFLAPHPCFCPYSAVLTV